MDPSKITFRISTITGGKLQRLLPSGTWQDMTPETGETYYAFTFADLQAGNVAFLPEMDWPLATVSGSPSRCRRWMTTET